jgi:hypothetical protein
MRADLVGPYRKPPRSGGSQAGGIVAFLRGA